MRTTLRRDYIYDINMGCNVIKLLSLVLILSVSKFKAFHEIYSNTGNELINGENILEFILHPSRLITRLKMDTFKHFWIIPTFVSLVNFVPNIELQGGVRSTNLPSMTPTCLVFYIDWCKIILINKMKWVYHSYWWEHHLVQIPLLYLVFELY